MPPTYNASDAYAYSDGDSLHSAVNLIDDTTVTQADAMMTDDSRIGNGGESQAGEPTVADLAQLILNLTANTNALSLRLNEIETNARPPTTTTTTTASQPTPMTEPESFPGPTTTTTTTPNTEEWNCYRPHLPNPDKYDHSRPEEWPAFMTNMNFKLTTDAAQFRNESEKAAYMFSRLSGDAMLRIHPWVQQYDHDPNVFTVANLSFQMNIAFGNQRLREQAGRQLSRLKQGNKRFCDYLPEFDRLLLQSGAFSSWLDETKKDRLTDSLNSKMHYRLVGYPRAVTYNDYCLQLHALADDIEAYESLHGSTGPGSGRSQRYNTPSPYSIPPRPPPPTPTTPAPVAAPARDPNAMDWEPTTSQARSRAKWVPESVLEQRAKNGQCFRCGTDAHRIRDCPALPARPPKPRVNNVQSNIPPLLEDDKDEDPIEGPQGKE